MPLAGHLERRVAGGVRRGFGHLPRFLPKSSARVAVGRHGGEQFLSAAAGEDVAAVAVRAGHGRQAVDARCYFFGLFHLVFHPVVVAPRVDVLLLAHSGIVLPALHVAVPAVLMAHHRPAFFGQEVQLSVDEGGVAAGLLFHPPAGLVVVVADAAPDGGHEEGDGGCQPQHDEGGAFGGGQRARASGQAGEEPHDEVEGEGDQDGEAGENDPVDVLADVEGRGRSVQGDGAHVADVVRAEIEDVEDGPADAEEEESGEEEDKEDFQQFAQATFGRPARLRLGGVLPGLAYVAHDFVAQVLHVHRPSLHPQAVFRRAGLGDDNPEDQVDDNHRTHGEPGEQHGQQAEPQGVDAEEAGQSGADAAQHLVVRVAEQFLARAFLALFPGRGGIRCRPVSFLLSVHLLRVADARDDVLHVFDGDGFHSLGCQFGEEFGHAPLDVLGYLLPAFLAREVAAHVVLVLVQQLVRVLVDGVERAEHVDGDVLFHCVSVFKVWVISGPLLAAGARPRPTSGGSRWRPARSMRCPARRGKSPRRA